ncbi:MAG TPA: glycolate oxidase subunit GlcE [Stellaceae bacterium]|jgi:glycolate oxidase FAD binding subunit|nr:glycolate oxidase subunit GlcE [Stellaceae bacterium]
MTRFVPTSIDELRAAIATALAAEEPVELLAGGTKRGLGRPLQTPHVVDLTRLSGIRDYAPNELVLTAGAATPLTAIDRALNSAGQMLAFEPPDWRALLGQVHGSPTLGGILACNLSGPRRIKAGAARDHFLGFSAVSGRAEAFKAGGKVVKNVTGYDLPKLMAGSYGTLAALAEVTVKVLPRPETAATVLIAGVAPDDAVRAMAAALGSPHEISGAAYIPAATRRPAPLPATIGIVALRIEGPEPSVAFRRDALLAELAGAEKVALSDADTAALWRDVANVAPLSGLADRAVWRVSVAPSRGAEVAQSIARQVDTTWFLDWGGGLLWLAVVDPGDAGAAVIRAALAGQGHATLVRGMPGLRAAVPVFQPQPTPLAALSRRIKEGFDPRYILNPSRMVEGI